MARFTPLLPGATARERALACVGAFFGVGLAGVVGGLVHPGEVLPWLAVSMGASAVLLFVVPSSPMAQPWPIVGGNGISALVGFATGRAFGHGAIACGAAVALAIAAMSISRSLHPPGGGAALTGVIGGALVEEAGWLFPLAPVALDAAILVAVGWAFHRLAGRAYPHRHPSPASPAPAVAGPGVGDEDLDAVLASMGEAFDIEREDLRRLLSALRARGGPPG